mmetsp:Transcript_46763/g.100099  ORF Transcript_46763/g.100099 Transcript_46763/m.100099 type:complete len:218 (-) Transcript_46763:1854-2507(-)
MHPSSPQRRSEPLPHPPIPLPTPARSAVEPAPKLILGSRTLARAVQSGERPLVDRPRIRGRPLRRDDRLQGEPSRGEPEWRPPDQAVPSDPDFVQSLGMGKAGNPLAVDVCQIGTYLARRRRRSGRLWRQRPRSWHRSGARSLMTRRMPWTREGPAPRRRYLCHCRCRPQTRESPANASSRPPPLPAGAAESAAGLPGIAGWLAGLAHSHQQSFAAT